MITIRIIDVLEQFILRFYVFTDIQMHPLEFLLNVINLPTPILTLQLAILLEVRESEQCSLVIHKGILMEQSEELHGFLELVLIEEEFEVLHILA